MKLFVYGTLKRGFHNHHVMGDAKFITSGAVKDMILHKGPGFPYAVDKEGTFIVGELFEIDNLERCDRLEGYPHHYNRKEVTVHYSIGDEGHEEQAWIYFVGPDFNLGRYQETTNRWE